MAESDPTKIRAYRQNNDPRDIESEEDPLVELARIVSEDNGFQNRQARADAARAGPMDSDAFSADLEAELLQELESSFSARPAQPRQNIAPAVLPVRPVARQHDDADDAVRDVAPARAALQPRGETGRQQDEPADDSEQSWDSRFADPDFQPAEAAHDARQTPRQAEEANESWDEPGEEPQWAPAAPAGQRGLQGRLDRPAAHRNDAQEPGERQAARGQTPDRERNARWRERAAERRAERQERIAERANQADRAPGPAAPQVGRQGRIADDEPGRRRAAGAGFAAGAAAGWNDLDDGTDAPEHPPAQAEWAASGEYRDELRTTFGDMDEAQNPSERRGATSDHVEGELTEEMEASYSDPSFGGHWEDQTEYDDSDEPRVAAAASGRGYAAARGERGRSRKVLVTIAGVLGVVLIGGTVAAFLQSDAEVSSGPPPVIAAQDGPVKVVPEGSEQASEETAGEAVYNRVAGRPAETDEQIVDGAEEPREISRIVLPAPTADEPLARGVGEEGTEDGAASDELDVGPRRVRTYVVRPDGTIVASSEAGAAQSADQGQEVVASEAPAEPLEADPVQTTAINGGASPNANSAAMEPAAPETTASAPVATPVPDPAGVDASAPETATEQADAAMLDTTELAAADIASEPADAVPVPTPASPEPTATIAEPSGDEPVDLVGAPPAEQQVAAVPSAAPALPPGETGYVVQVSSQRSMEQAQSSFAALQSSYPSVLGQYQPDIQQAEVADQGTFYRVRVGPWSTRAEAIEVCESLQAAGGSCFVSQ